MLKNILLLVAIYSVTPATYAQNNLAKRITINAQNEHLQNVLQELSKKGEFTFSYNTSILPKDSLVSLKAYNMMVQDILDSLLNGNFEYKEASNYVVLRPCPNSLSLIPEKSEPLGRKYVVSGYIIDNANGLKIKDASVYDKQLLKSTLTDHQGYFKLKIKTNNQAIRLTVTKDQYKEITVTMLPAVTVGRNDSAQYGFQPGNGVIATYFGKVFVSSRQRVQNINLAGFFSQSPVQVSFIPGLSTHGFYNSQMVNTVSLNALAGYSAGVNGVELAGLFNVNKYNVKNFQGAGLINTVGGTVDGVQLAGIGNVVLDSVQAFQGAGIFNAVKSNFSGVQMAGIVNANKGTLNGTQMAGIANLSGKQVKGTQLAGIVNVSVKGLKGAQFAGIGNTTIKPVNGWQMAGIYNVSVDSLKGGQLAGIVNYTKKLKGFQMGLVNIADTLEGVSLGLLNLSKNGYHKLAISSNEVTNVNLALITGNAKLYTAIRAGYNLSDTAKVFSFGVAMGHDFVLSKKLAIGAQMSYDQLYLGSWKHSSSLVKAGTNVQLQLIKGLALFAGPYYNVYFTNQTNKFKNYSYPILNRGLAYHSYSNKVKGWIGFEAGIRLF
ncbi:peptidase associated/transthyretin-like domain-containing protein [Pedobacter arcticus]|uniref:STN and carboxypeptidase regulatory-like domain-containing protein n=1 Tax=Pedobacter arcticus TaxID=752140 RepID=UPI0002EBA66B|nr:STN and carboxypeptidase regulatory-like domain-containing protein [Pedobacter arcticus]